MDLNHKLIFYTPSFVEKPYGWLQHTPFAAFLVELLRPRLLVELGTHTGNSYFAFCQAIDQLKLATKSYAVDTWEGDEHASFYNDEIFKRVKQINDEHFNRFSSLMKMTFDQALSYFSDHTIDLLHIDGLHTYEAVKHDFETWLPKLSHKGVIIFHDIAVRERGFGVWKLWEELKTKYLSFDFLHGNGLGVLCVGKNVDKNLLKFINNAEEISDIRNLFAMLGNRILALQEKEDLRKEISTLKQNNKKAEKIISEKEKQIEKHTQKEVAHNAKLDEYKAAIKRRDVIIESLRNELNISKNATIDQKTKLIKYSETIRKRDEEKYKSDQKHKELLIEIENKEAKIHNLSEVLLIEKNKIENLKTNIEAINNLLLNANQTISKRDEEKSISDQKHKELLIEIENKETEVHKLSKALSIEKNKIENLETNIEAINNLLLNANQTIRKSENENKIASKLASAKELKIIEIKETVKSLQKSHSQLKLKTEKTEKENLKLKRTNSELKKQIDLIVNSNSWILTKPLRYAKKVLRQTLFAIVFTGKLVFLTVTFQTKKLKRELQTVKYYKVISKSGLFDKNWYLKQYPDVAKSGINPIIHYLKRGVIEGRNPSEIFFTKEYLIRYGDVADAGINPLVHYVKYGKFEGRETKFICNNEGISKPDIEDNNINITSNVKPTPSILYVIHDGGGGMVYTSFDLFQFVSKTKTAYILTASKYNWQIYQHINNQNVRVASYKFSNHWKETANIDNERQKALNNIHKRFNVTIVHIRVLLGTGIGLIKYFKTNGTPVIISFHDFSVVCPNIQLICNGKFCGGDCNAEKSDIDCNYSKGWFGNIGRLRPNFRNKWSAMISEQVSKCDRYIVTSSFTKEVVLKNYPLFDSSKFRLIEHGRDFQKKCYCTTPDPTKKIKIIYFGALNESKGIKLALDLMKHSNSKGGRIKLHVIGNIVGLEDEYKNTENIIVYGKYERKDLITYFEKIRPSFTIIPSIWPETFSHTLTESWAFGVPPICSSYGAVGERIIREQAGWILKPVDEKEWYSKIIDIAENPKEFKKIHENVLKINFKTIEQMGLDYLKVYEELENLKTNSVDPVLQKESDAVIMSDQNEETNEKERRIIKKIRIKLLEYGFTERAIVELKNYSEQTEKPFMQSLATWELALWYSNFQSKETAKTTLEHIRFLRKNDYFKEIQQQIAVIETEALMLVGEEQKAKDLITKEIENNKDANLFLAKANTCLNLADKFSELNNIYETYNLCKISYTNENTLLYDKLNTIVSENYEIKADSVKVTIIVPTFNAEKTIKTSIESIQNQTHKNIEILVVDDCSTDNTAKIIHEYAKRDSRIKYFKTLKNSGPYVARNIALKEATGTYITCNDSDDWSHSQKIEFQKTHLDNNPNIIANISQWARVTEDFKFQRRNNPGFYIQINLSSLMFRREEVISKIGFWDNVRYGADTEFHKRLLITFGHDKIVELSPVPLSFARLTETSLTSNQIYGYQGFPMGSRKEYRDSYVAFYKKQPNLKYQCETKNRPFPIPDIMNPNFDTKALDKRYFELVIMLDFRIDDPNIYTLLENTIKVKKTENSVGLVHLGIYDFGNKKTSENKIRNLVDGRTIKILVYGDTVSCDTLIISQHFSLLDKQIHMPKIISKEKIVIVNNIKTEDSAEHIVSHIEQCASNMRYYFDDIGKWYFLNKSVFSKIENQLNTELKHSVTTNNLLVQGLNKKWEPVQFQHDFTVRNDTSANKYQAADSDPDIVIIDIENIDKFNHSNPNGILVVMPCIDTLMGMDTAKFLKRRAGIECKIVVVNDTKRIGFINVLNKTVERTQVKYVVYLAQDAYPGIDWLKTAYETLEKSGNGLLAFNDGKWRGRIAGFGMIRIEWAQKIYGEYVLYPGYKAHKADNEITVIARLTNNFDYNPDSVLIEIDKNKIFKENIPEDKQLFHARFKNGFDGLVAIEKLKTVSKEYFVPWKDIEEELTNKKNTQSTFVFYRIIGNDLYPRHIKGQSLKNLQFIIANEPVFENCEKRFILNRIVDKNEEKKIVSFLEKHNITYETIPFVEDEYNKIGIDNEIYDFESLFNKPEFAKFIKEKQHRAIVAALRLKNNYIMNNNGARNTALKNGRKVARWILPFDGNCFLTTSAWNSIVEGIENNPEKKYHIVPMTRVVNNNELLDPSFIPNLVEEPQIIFRNDAELSFDERFCYGRRPKVELLHRLNVDGAWNSYLQHNDPWDIDFTKIGAAKQWVKTGWVARLFSGNKEQEQNSEAGAQNRAIARVEGIISAITVVDNSISKSFNGEYQSFNEKNLNDEIKLYKSGNDINLNNCVNKLIGLANKALSRTNYSVINKTTLPPSGNKHDYWHPAPYWWPNPQTKDRLPFIRQDGKRVPGTHLYEPSSNKYDRTRLQYMFDDSFVLALAWKFTDEKSYILKGIEILKEFFIAPETRMNPNLNYSQVRMGHDNNLGASTGLIETKDMYYYLDAVRIFNESGLLQNETLILFKKWLNDFMIWLTSSPQGIKEAQAQNNHGICYDLQIASIASFLNDYVILQNAILRSISRIPHHFAMDGSQPHELKRTITAHYCCFNFQSWLNMAQIASNYNTDLWKYIPSNGGGMIKGAKWLLNYMGQEWPYPQDEDFDNDRFIPIWFKAKEHIAFESKSGLYSDAKYTIKSIFFPHDGIRPFWNLG